MPATGAPLGLHPFGLAPPVEGVDSPTGPPVLSRFIDPVAGDYQLDAATGQFAGMPSVRQMVVLALATRRGSSAVIPDLGAEQAEVIDAQFERTEQNNVRAALRHLIDGRLLRIRDITITQLPTGRYQTVVEYTDLTLPQGAPARNDTVETPIA